MEELSRNRVATGSFRMGENGVENVNQGWAKGTEDATLKSPKGNVEGSKEKDAGKRLKRFLG